MLCKVLSCVSVVCFQCCCVCLFTRCVVLVFGLVFSDGVFMCLSKVSRDVVSMCVFDVFVCFS